MLPNLRDPERAPSLLRFVVGLFLLLFVFSGCSKKAYKMSAPDEAYGYYDEDVRMEADMAPMPMAPPMAKKAKVASRSSGSAAPPPPPPPPGGNQADAPPPPEQKVARKIHYAGFARLRVVSVEESTDALTELAKGLGGFVESVSGRVVTLRVPVDDFDDAFTQVTELGDLMERSITARDVTEAFTAVDLRLSTAKRTRDRLVELLARAEDEKEKLALIAQIQRVSEEIDRMESQLRTLDALSKLSRITVELVPREAQAWQSPDDETAEMAWIRQLSPFRPDLVSDGKRHNIDVPEGMVQLTPKRRFIAEGPDGSRIWTGRLPNEPRGASAFWIDAVKARLADQFASAETEQVGDYTLVRLTDRGDSPYTWWIAVRTDENSRWIDVVEVYFPTPEELERFGPAVRSSLTAGGGAS